MIKELENLNIYGDNEVRIRNTAGNEYKARFITNGAVELYYDNAKKFETTSAGAKVTGQLRLEDGDGSSGSNKISFGTGNDLSIYHTGSNSVIAETGAGNLNIQANQFFVKSGDGTASYSLCPNQITKLVFTITTVKSLKLLNWND